jgi:hypothetical protein
VATEPTGSNLPYWSLPLYDYSLQLTPILVCTAGKSQVAHAESNQDSVVCMHYGNQTINPTNPKPIGNFLLNSTEINFWNGEYKMCSKFLSQIKHFMMFNMLQ